MSDSTSASQQSEKDQANQNDSGEQAKIDGEHPLESIVENLEETARHDDDGQLSVGELVDSFGRRSYGPLLAVPALIALIPVVGAIPGVSIVTAIVIMMVCIQMLIWNEGIWLPDRLRQLNLKANKVAQGAQKSKSWVSWSDGFISPRLEFLSRAPLSYLTPILCLVLAVCMIPLAFVPMGVAPPAATILLLALGIVAGDGVLLIVGYLASLACGWFMVYMLG